MAEETLIRGDAYQTLRPLFRHVLADDAHAPFDLTGCTIRTTFKVAPTDPTTDTTDATATIKGVLIVDGTGVATTEDNLYMVGLATAGTFELRMTAAETLALPLNEQWLSDVKVWDSNDEPITFLFTETPLSAQDGYTNRTTG